MKLAYTILYVKDVDASMRFYAAAFGLEIKFIAPGNSYGEMITGATTLSFASHEQAATNLKDGFEESRLSRSPFGIEIGFTTDNVEEAFKHAVQAGAAPVTEPVFKPHGQTVAYVRDMDGFLVEICTPMG
jgi:catechol 2,3-dioxygenase-like lactoylglutathione lyase family enzyme